MACARGLNTASLIVVGMVVASCASHPVEPPPAAAPLGPAPTAAAKPPRSSKPAPLPQDRYITVERGQSLGRLAEAHNVPKQAIIAANHLTPPYELKTGMRLFIPGRNSTPPHGVAETKPKAPQPTRAAVSRSARPARATSSGPDVIPLDDPNPIPAPAGVGGPE